MKTDNYFSVIIITVAAICFFSFSLIRVLCPGFGLLEAMHLPHAQSWVSMSTIVLSWLVAICVDTGKGRIDRACAIGILVGLFVQALGSAGYLIGMEYAPAVPYITEMIPRIAIYIGAVITKVGAAGVIFSIISQFKVTQDSRLLVAPVLLTHMLMTSILASVSFVWSDEKPLETVVWVILLFMLAATSLFALFTKKRTQGEIAEVSKLAKNTIVSSIILSVTMAAFYGVFDILVPLKTNVYLLYLTASVSLLLLLMMEHYAMRIHYAAGIIFFIVGIVLLFANNTITTYSGSVLLGLGAGRLIITFFPQALQPCKWRGSILTITAASLYGLIQLFVFVFNLK